MLFWLIDWLTHPKDQWRNEALLGAGISFFYGMPAWIALPALVYADRATLPSRTRTIFIAPAIAAIALFVVIEVLPR